MLLEEINPCVRFIRKLSKNNDNAYNEVISYDSRLFYTISGHITIEANDEIYKMKSGDLLIIHSGVKYQILETESNFICYAVNFDFNSSIIDKETFILPSAPEYYNPNKLTDKSVFDDIPLFNKVVNLNKMYNIESLLEKIELEYKHHLLYFNNISNEILSEIIFTCARKLQQPHPSKPKNTAKSIIEYIHKHYMENLTNKSIGLFFGFHPNYINSIIKSSTGMSLHQYVIHVRINHALLLLENGNLSISEIAEKCGFSNIYYFSRYFKTITGFSPSDTLKG